MGRISFCTNSRTSSISRISAATVRPRLDTRGDYLAWARVMSAEFNALRNAADAGLPTLLDDYGATNPAEFFAVITEAFFERPRALKKRHAALFAQLQRFYRQDPTTYSAEPVTA